MTILDDINYYGNGKFEFVDDYSREYFVSAHKTITRCKLWDWLRNYTPNPDRGFMYSQNVPELEYLNSELMKDPINQGHSGSSYGITMRNMEYIAKNGYEVFKMSFYD